MSATARTLDLGRKGFAAVAVLVLVVALYQWVEFLLIYRDPSGLASAFTWTFLMVVAFLPVFIIEYVQSRGE